MALKSAVQFLREVRFELSKVEWPEFNEWVGSTVVVLVLVCFFGVYLGIVDLGLTKLVSYILSVHGK